jgi:hypothetical protein
VAESGGISGVAVGLAAVGGLFVYAGFQGVSPLQALKDVSSGKSKPLLGSPVSWTNDPTRRSGGGTVQAGAPAGGGIGPALVAALRRRKGELYSQGRRWQAGYSDCSSFLGKGLKDIGIAPPGASVTGSYLAWSALKTIQRSQIQEGDFLCGAGHIAVATSPTMAIGQQNGRSNVQEGPIDSIMWGQPSWVPRRYVGASSGSSGPRTVEA